MLKKETSFTHTATAFLLVFSLSGQAAEHLDSPAVANDPAADINDLYAFMKPSDPNELILALTVMPLATANSRFPNVVNYQFNIQNTAGGAAAQSISCCFKGKAVI